MKYPQTTEERISRLTRKIRKIGINKELPPMVSTILVLKYLGQIDALEASRGTYPYNPNDRTADTLRGVCLIKG